MSEFMNNIGSYLENAATLLMVIAALMAAGLVLFAVSVAVNLLHPLGTATRWLFGVRPDAPPNEIVLGLSHGFRLLAWTTAVGVVAWICWLFI